MWGYYNARDRSLANHIFNLITNKDIAAKYNGNLKSPKGSDQYFLSAHVNPLINPQSIIHDSYLCTSYGGSPFPTKRLGNCFIGSPSECDEKAKFVDCPEACRPANHKDWTQC